jgi:hypothetical protein
MAEAYLSAVEALAKSNSLSFAPHEDLQIGRGRLLSVGESDIVRK